MLHVEREAGKSFFFVGREPGTSFRRKSVTKACSVFDNSAVCTMISCDDQTINASPQRRQAGNQKSISMRLCGQPFDFTGGLR